MKCGGDGFRPGTAHTLAHAATARAWSLKHFFSQPVPVPLSSHLCLLTTPLVTISTLLWPGTKKGMGYILHGDLYSTVRTFAPPILWFSSDLGIEINHSHLVTSAYTLYCLSDSLVPKKARPLVSAPRLWDRKIPTDVLHCSIAFEPFSVLHLPVPNGRRPLIPTSWCSIASVWL